MRIVFLYTRLPDYFLRSIAYLTVNFPVEVTIIRYDADKNAQFVFESLPHINLIYKSSFSSISELSNFITEINPSMIYCSGWNDKEYMSIISHWNKKIPTIMGLDNPWENTFRKQVGVLLFRILNKMKFSHIWVAGYAQYEFAKKLGYPNYHIIYDLYSADVIHFQKAYIGRMAKINVGQPYPKKLLFVGRFVPYKQPKVLVKAFNELLNEQKTGEWELVMIGEGPLKNELKQFENNRIRIKDFIHPSKLVDEMENAGAFCLPSKSEHWGVVIHEAVSAGLPVITTQSTYAASRFVFHNHNGFIFTDTQFLELKSVLTSLFNMTDTELTDMSTRSYHLSRDINHEKWAASLLSIIRSH